MYRSFTFLVTIWCLLCAVTCKQAGFYYKHLMDDGNYVIRNLTDLCIAFNISLVNCSCSLFTINGTDENQFPIFCSLQKEIEVILLRPKTLSQAYAGITVISSTVGIIGNIAVVIVAIKNRNMLPACKCLIALLALSDLYFAIQQCLLAIPLFWTNVWLYDEFMCKFLRSGVVLSTLISITLILTIAIERYIGILYPLRKRVSGHFIYYLTAGLLLLAIVSSIPLMIAYKIHPVTKQCREMWPQKRRDALIYDWFIIISFFLLPVLMIGFMYVRIIHHLNKQSSVSFHFSDNEKEKRWKENKRIMRILVSILAVFILCVFPNRFAWLYFEIRKYEVSYITYIAISYFALLPYPIHVAVNPIIYSVVDKTWRKDILQLLNLKRKQLRHSQSSAVSNITTTTPISHSSSHAFDLVNDDENKLPQTTIKEPENEAVFN